MTAPPLFSAEWDGETLRPLRRFSRQCDDALVVGEVYRVEVVDEAQSARDRAYFAELRDVWRNLPEDMAEAFPSVDSFRHYLLIKCGFCATTRLAFASAKAARDALPVMQSEGAILHVEGAVLTVAKPLSQRMRGGMDKEQRHRSQQETLDMAVSMIGVTREQATQNARQAA